MSRGAFDASPGFCSTGFAVPAASSSTTRRTSFAPSAANRVFERRRVFVRIDRRPLLREARTGVEAGRHLDHGVAGFGFAVQNRPLHGGGTAILRQQRTVQIDAAEARRGERRGAEDFAVVADDQEVGGERRRGVLGNRGG